MPFCVSDTITPPCSYRNDYFIGSDIVYAMDTNSSAIFGQFDYNFTEHFKVTSGLRYTYDDISIDLENFQRYRYFINIGAPALRNEDKSSNNVSGKVALQYITDNKDLGYLSYSRGYKGPGFADTPAPTQDDIFIRPEIVSNYEAGVKTNWLRNRLIANASVFLQKFDDYQVNSFDPSIGQNTIRNAAKVTSKGLEFGLTAMLTDDLTLNTSAMLLDSEFDSFPGAACYPNQPTCTENGTFDAQGLTPPTAAKLTNTTSFTYSFDVMEMGYGFATLSYYHRSPVNYLVNEAPMTRIGNVDQFAINVGINFESGWEVTLFCKNCNNDVVPTAVALDGGDSSIYGTATTVQVWGFNSVRNIGLKVGYHF
jgi:iron complex outermembrane receptor protein